MSRARTLLRSRATALLAAVGAAVLLFPLDGARAQSSAGAGALEGDAENGKILYDEKYRCYACHGFTGETGNPRLIPIRFPQAAFIEFLRDPTGEGRMPAYASEDVSDPMLADLYAYIRSIPSSSPALESIPLLDDN